MLLSKAVFTVFDFETTGLSPYSGDKICEIGAVKVGPGKKTRKFHSLVDPQRPISRGAFFVNRITPDMLGGAPKINEILPDFMRFIEGSVLVAYNAGFDIGFLECALGKNKHSLDSYFIIDALSLARELFPKMSRYNLASVLRSLKIKPSREHRALSDAYMTLKVFRRELRILRKKGIKTIGDISRTKPKRAVPVKAIRDYRVELIKKAIREEKKLHITYLSSWSRRMTERVISPRDIQGGYDRVYIVAYCYLRKEERNFRLDSILRIKEKI